VVLLGVLPPAGAQVGIPEPPMDLRQAVLVRERLIDRQRLLGLGQRLVEGPVPGRRSGALQVPRAGAALIGEWRRGLEGPVKRLVRRISATEPFAGDTQIAVQGRQQGRVRPIGLQELHRGLERPQCRCSIPGIELDATQAGVGAGQELRVSRPPQRMDRPLGAPPRARHVTRVLVHQRHGELRARQQNLVALLCRELDGTLEGRLGLGERVGPQVREPEHEVDLGLPVFASASNRVTDTSTIPFVPNGCVNAYAAHSRTYVRNLCKREPRN